MTIAVIALSIALAGALSLVGWLAYRLHTVTRSSSAQLLAMDDERDKAIQRADGLDFELKAARSALADAERTIEGLATQKQENPNADLDPDDVTARSVRAAIKARAAEARRAGDVPAGAGKAVHPTAAADAGESADVLPAGPLDPNESLL